MGGFFRAGSLLDMNSWVRAQQGQPRPATRAVTYSLVCAFYVAHVCGDQ